MLSCDGAWSCFQSLWCSIKFKRFLENGRRHATSFLQAFAFRGWSTQAAYCARAVDQSRSVSGYFARAVWMKNYATSVILSCIAANRIHGGSRPMGLHVFSLLATSRLGGRCLSSPHRNLHSSRVGQFRLLGLIASSPHQRPSDGNWRRRIF